MAPDRLRARRLSLTLVLLLASPGAGAGAGGAPAQEVRFEPGEVVELLSRARADRGLPPLRWIESLSVAARAQASSLVLQARAFPSRQPDFLAQLPYETGDLGGRLAEAGYEAADAKATLVVGESLPAEALGHLLAPGEAFHDEFLVNDLEDLGLGAARLDDLVFVVVVLGRSRGDRFTAGVRSLPELAELRSRLLDEANAARRRHRRPRLRPDPCLDGAAQGYAERMLEGGFFGHVAPDGDDVEDRVRAARCPVRVVAENLAQGPLAPAEAVVSWMESGQHRRNLLDPDLTRVGFGMAYGRNEHGHRIFWVQLLAR